jgi:hypothetical protein
MSKERCLTPQCLTPSLDEDAQGNVSRTRQEGTPKRSIMELHGLGQEIWDGVDAQEYVNKLREEWDHRP